jgi:hypothetical protein
LNAQLDDLHQGLGLGPDRPPVVLDDGEEDGRRGEGRRCAGCRFKLDFDGRYRRELIVQNAWLYWKEKRGRSAGRDSAR